MSICKRIFMVIKKYGSRMLPLLGSFIIAAGWSWYHLKHQPLYIKGGIWAGVLMGYYVFKYIYAYLTVKLNRHVFWQTEFKLFLDKIFFWFSLLFLVFFSNNEIISLIYFVFVLGVIYVFLQKYISSHPQAVALKAANKSIFEFILFLFIMLSLLQYSAYHYYIFDSNIIYHSIVLFRSWAMTMFWVLGFSLAGILYFKIKSRFRLAFLIFWVALFVFALFIWMINVGIMYFSGLYFSPIILEHAKGSAGVIFNRFSAIIFAAGVCFLAAFFFMFKRVIKIHKQVSPRYWYFYNFALITLAIMSLVGLSSFQNTPEFSIVKSFVEYWSGSQKKVVISPYILKKLQNFGLNYDLNNFNIAHKETVFSPSSTAKVLPENLTKNKPNIIIIFLESFSSDLTGVYNPRFTDLTPGLNSMAADANTTVFKKYYNASTPTITGLLSQLCSFLPPTGHNEIQEEKHLQNHHLLCLPKVLKENGYKYTDYVTAVEKDFANKDTIMASMGVDSVYGTEELKSLVSGEPLSWGYSDHQLFPAFLQIINSKSKEPFLAMLSTVDTHPPFNLAKDAIKYQDGKSDLLNSFHTTDDAFAKFWNEFKNSRYKDNTIVIAVADHAIFPGAFSKDIFPNDAGKKTFYDENTFLMYVPNTVLPKTVDMYSSGLDFTPTILQILNINIPNSFEGHSIFDDRVKYPNVLGMHEFGLYINQTVSSSRKIDYAIPGDLRCKKTDYTNSELAPLTLCEYLDFFKWNRQMFEEGRFWEN